MLWAILAYHVIYASLLCGVGGLHAWSGAIFGGKKGGRGVLVMVADFWQRGEEDKMREGGRCDGSDWVEYKIPWHVDSQSASPPPEKEREEKILPLWKV